MARGEAAAAVEAGELVTRNLGDFPEVTLRPLEIEGVGPDDFVVSMVEADTERVGGRAPGTPSGAPKSVASGNGVPGALGASGAGHGRKRHALRPP